MTNWREAWYLLRYREKTWKSTIQALNDPRIQTCCPLLYERQLRSDKKHSFRKIFTPLFPGYVFVRFNPVEIHTTAITSLPGIMDFVRKGKNIAVISDECVEELKNRPPMIFSAESTISCAYINDDLVSEIDRIFTTKNPYHRVRQLMTLLSHPSNN